MKDIKKQLALLLILGVVLLHLACQGNNNPAIPARDLGANPTITNTVPPIPTATATNTATNTATPTITDTPTNTATDTPTATATPTP